MTSVDILDDDVLYEIMLKLKAYDLYKFSLVCRSWNSVFHRRRKMIFEARSMIDLVSIARNVKLFQLNGNDKWIVRTASHLNMKIFNLITHIKFPIDLKLTINCNEEEYLTTYCKQNVPIPVFIPCRALHYTNIVVTMTPLSDTYYIKGYRWDNLIEILKMSEEDKKINDYYEKILDYSNNLLYMGHGFVARCGMTSIRC